MAMLMIKVLLIDDDAFILNAYQRMLRHAPYDCSYLQQAEQLWRMPELARFDVVIADQQMPGLTGSELLRQLQQQYPLIKRVLVSGDLDLALKQLAPDLTLSAALPKPCSKLALLQCLQRVSGEV